VEKTGVSQNDSGGSDSDRDYGSGMNIMMVFAMFAAVTLALIIAILKWT